jgi:uncharacterized protein YjbJ (UPF0337 family)
MVSSYTRSRFLDSAYEGEGKADQFKGKVQNTVAGLKDTLRGK